MALSDRHHNLAIDGWQFGMKLTTEHVWDAFVAYTLLKKANTREEQLVDIPHDKAQKDRFSQHMHHENQRTILLGQEEVPHTCNKCTRVFLQSDGSMR